MIERIIRYLAPGRNNSPAQDKRHNHRVSGEVSAARLRTASGFLTKLCLVCLAVAVVSGCGRYKEDLENAKQQIDRLNSETKKLSEIAANLEKEKTRLNDELKLLSDKNAKIQQEVAELRRAKEALSKENADLKKRNSAIQEEATTLKREKSDLLRELEELKKRGGESAEPGKALAPGAAETTPRQTAKEQVSKPQEQSNPCDAVVEFMKRNGEIVRQHTGEERARLVEQVKRDYAARMRGAPERAIKAAEAWVSELISNWDKPKDDTVFNLITKRNAALEACKKNPEDAGF